MRSVESNTPIKKLIDILCQSLGIEEYDEVRIFKPVWLRIFQDNLIFNVGLLRRVNPSHLAVLGLPVLLEEEIEKILETGRNRTPLLTLSRLAVQEGIISDSKHSQGTAHIHERAERFKLNLSDEEKALLKKSWYQLSLAKNHLQPEAGLQWFASRFYPTFFEFSPTAERLFKKSTMERQAQSLINMLTWIITNLENMSQLVPTLAQMGGRHEIYGVKYEEYSLFGKAVAKTFQSILHQEFSPAAFKAWESCIVKIADLMMHAGIAVKQGYRGELLREKNNGSWTKCWVSLTLDMIYFFKNDSFTILKAQYPLEGVTNIYTQKGSLENRYITLSSTNPTFILHLGAEKDSILEDWILEIEWRLQAIFRVFGNDDFDSTGDTSSFTDSRSIKRDYSKQLVKTTKLIRMKKIGMDEQSKTDEVQTIIQLSERQKELIKSSWGTLLRKEFKDETGSTVSGLSRFFEEFYDKFFTVNPSGKRLFEEAGMQVQGRALVKMLSMIVKSIDNPESLEDTLKTLGGRHEIYGVEPGDYIQFANVSCDVIESIVGLECGEMRDAWFKIMMTLGTKLQSAGRKIRKDGLHGIFHHRFKKDNSWKKSVISLSLDTLSIYRDEKKTKLRTSIPLKEINDVSLLNIHGNDIVCPTEFCLDIDSSNYRIIKIYLCANSEKIRDQWMMELNWRVQAVHRVYKEVEDDTGSSGSVKKKMSTLLGYGMKKML